MHIHSLLPILINILNGQTGPQKTDNVVPGPGQDLKPVAVQSPEKTHGNSAVLKTLNSGEGDQTTSRQPTPGHNLPDFLPLPLKSPLFPQSSFFIKNERENPENQGNGHQTNIFINLRTEALGILWVSVTSTEQSLNIYFYTESESFTSAIKEIFDGLTEDLRTLGYPSIKVTGITRPGIRNCQDIAPGSKNSQNYLVDLEV